MPDLIFAYLAVWAVILGRLAFDEWYLHRSRLGRRRPAANTM